MEAPCRPQTELVSAEDGEPNRRRADVAPDHKVGWNAQKTQLIFLSIF